VHFDRTARNPNQTTASVHPRHETEPLEIEPDDVQQALAFVANLELKQSATDK
jgi:hypothetical protein